MYYICLILPLQEQRYKKKDEQRKKIAANKGLDVSVVVLCCCVVLLCCFVVLLCCCVVVLCCVVLLWGGDLTLQYTLPLIIDHRLIDAIQWQRILTNGGTKLAEAPLCGKSPRHTRRAIQSPVCN